MQPPKLPLKLFRFYCSEERLEELEGDLYEVFKEKTKEGKVRFPSLLYWWLVIRSFRSYALRRPKIKNHMLTSTLTSLRHNFKVAVRNLLKHKAITSINILGLVIGIAAFMAIFNVVIYEKHFNSQIPAVDRIFRIYTSYSGSFTSLNNGVAIPIGSYVEETFSGLDHVAYFHQFAAKVEISGEKTTAKKFDRAGHMLLAAPSFFHVIDQYDWIIGSPEKSLSEPFKVVLTTDQAKKYFDLVNYSDVIGKNILYQDSLKLTVSGIVQRPTYSTDFNFTDFISHKTIEASWLKNSFSNKDWGSTSSSSQLWIKASAGTPISTILSQIATLDAHVLANTDHEGLTQNYKLQPLSEVHFATDLGIFDHERRPADKQTLTILIAVSFSILLIAIFNFVNLETAQSSTKTKEVGVRKVLGSQKGLLLNRFLTESLLVSSIAMVLAIPLAHYSLTYFEEFVPSGMSLDFSNPYFWINSTLLMLAVGIIAGIYPAWMVSSLKPINALNPGANQSFVQGSFMRKSLIFLQFLFSQLLIVGTIVIAQQISFMLEKELGFENEGVVYFYTPYYEDYQKQQLLINEIQKIPQISDFSLQGTPPVQNGYSTSEIKYNTPEGQAILNAHQKSGDTSYMHFYYIDFLAGKNLLPNDTLRQLLINETMAHRIGYQNPNEGVGKTVEFREKSYVIQGVVEDFHFQSLHHEIEPMIFIYKENPRCLALKINRKEELLMSIDKLTDLYTETYPNHTLDVYFLDETVANFYESEQTMAKLASAATGIAVLISCLGLFGLISFTIVQKSKELGIRKILGASTIQITTVLSKEFMRLILISFIIAAPLSYYFLREWIKDFAYRTDIYWWIYLLGCVISLTIATASIGVKIWKASHANPIDSLRYE